MVDWTYEHAPSFWIVSTSWALVTSWYCGIAHLEWGFPIIEFWKLTNPSPKPPAFHRLGGLEPLTYMMYIIKPVEDQGHLQGKQRTIIVTQRSPKILTPLEHIEVCFTEHYWVNTGKTPIPWGIYGITFSVPQCLDHRKAQLSTKGAFVIFYYVIL